jgi:dipeptidyl aminopeptidase/acylaminoacyl peptidase
MPRLHAVCLAFVLTGFSAHAQPPAPAGGGKAPADRGDEEVRRLLLRLAPTPLPHGQRISALAFSADGRTVTTVSDAEAGVFLWDSATGKLLRQWHLPQRWLARSAVGAGGKVLATADEAGRVALWDVPTGKKLHVLKGTAGTSLALSPDGKSVVAGLGSGELGVWDVATGKQRGRLPRSAWSRGLPLTFSPDGKRIAAARPDGTVGVWDAEGGRELHSLPAGKTAVRLLAFTPSGRDLAACERGGVVRVWDMATARQRRTVQMPAGHDLTCGFFTPDGRALLTGGVDGTVRLWEMASGKERHCFPGLGDQVANAALTPDGQAVAIVGADNRALVRAVGGLAPAEGILGAAPRPKDVPTAWEDLTAPDAARAYRAVAALAERRAQAVAYLKERLKPAAVADAKEIARLIGDLNSASFAKRQKAMKALASLHEVAEGALETVLQGNPPAELRLRVQQLLERIKRGGAPAERLRTLRAVEVLEMIGTAEARHVLRNLARGAARDLLTEQARAALERLDKAPMAPR